MEYVIYNYLKGDGGVDLSGLPRHKSGANKGKIDWNESVGHTVKFVYTAWDGRIIEGELKILRKVGENLILEYKGEETKPINCSNLRSGAIGNIIDEYQFKVGDRFKDDKRDLTIIEIVEKGTKTYRYRCNKEGCGYEGNISESELVREYGCRACSSRVVTKNNCLYNKRRDLVDRFKIDIEVAKSVTYSSHKKIEVTCDVCKKTKLIKVNTLTCYDSIGCCSDGVSYAEKFMTYFFDAVGEPYKRQYSPNWDNLNGRKYDLYLPNRNAIVEVHGLQHYEEVNWARYGGRTLAEEQQNDREKKQIALANGINDYIILDCRESKMEWIVNSIRNSKLAEWFDLDKVDFEKIHKKTFKVLKLEAIKLWNEGLKVKEISEKLRVHKTTVSRWLNDGVKLGLCDYDGKAETSGANFIGLNSPCAKKVVMVDKDGNCDINKVKTCGDWIKELEINPHTITRLLNTNKGYDATRTNKKHLHGIKFYELDVYLKLKE